MARRDVDPVLEEKKEDYYQFLLKVHDIHETLLDTLDYDEMHKIGGEAEKVREYLRGPIHEIINDNKIEGDEEFIKQLVDAVIYEVIGFGPLEPLLEDSTVTDIFVNSPEKIFVESKGKVQLSHLRFINDQHVLRLVQRVASKSGRHLDLGTPYLDAQLPDGSRLHAIIPPIAIEGVKVSIRKFLFNKLDIHKLVDSGSMSSAMAHMLQICVRGRFNMVVCGGTGTGKTTLLNSLLDAIRPGERVITLEDTPELEPTHGHTIRLVTRKANAEGKGEVSQELLMINALRMRPDRVILGEMRGSEAFTLLHAMNTGQDGSMATLHASGTEEVLTRLLNMILMAKYSLSVESVRQQIAGALDLVVYIARLVDGSRRVMSISTVSKGEDESIKVHHLFKYRIDKINETQLEGEFEQFVPVLPPRIKNKLITAGLYNEFKEIFPVIEESS